MNNITYPIESFGWLMLEKFKSKDNKTHVIFQKEGINLIFISKKPIDFNKLDKPIILHSDSFVKALKETQNIIDEEYNYE